MKQAPWKILFPCDGLRSCVSEDGPAELRCPCGRLLLRFVEDAVELRCPRCKRSVMVYPDRSGTNPSEAGDHRSSAPSTQGRGPGDM